MATKLKGLKITSTDLVDQGANPDAYIRLFKRKDGAEGEQTQDTLIHKIAAALAGLFSNSADTTATIAKDAATFSENIEREKMRELTSEMYDFCYAFSDSLWSIICDCEQEEDGKRELMFTSLDEFAEAIRNAIPKWAGGHKAHDGETVAKSAAQVEAFNNRWAQFTKQDSGGDTGNNAPLFSTSVTCSSSTAT